MEDEFIRLHPGVLTVSEYEIQFTKLSKFATELLTTEQRRVRRFVQGLNMEIQEALAAAQITTFTEVLEKAQRVEIARGQVKVFQARKEVRRVVSLRNLRTPYHLPKLEE